MGFNTISSNIFKIIMISLMLYIGVWVLVYWGAWTSTKMSLSKAVTVIEHQIETDGALSFFQASSTIDKYMANTAYKPGSLCIYNISPFNGIGKYLGQPISADLSIYWQFAGKDYKMVARIDTVNRGEYNHGYNTPHEK